MALMKCHACGNEVSTESKTCPKCGAKVRPKKKGLGTVAQVFILLVLIGVVVSVISESSSPGGGSSTPPKPKEPSTEDRLEFKLVNWQKGGFDNVMLLTFTVKNCNPYAIKDMLGGCDLFAPSGTRVSTVVRVVHEKVDPGKTRRFNTVNMGLIDSESSNANCSVGGAQKA